MTDLNPRDWNAYHLSDKAGVQSPDNRQSPVALWLLAVRDAAVDYLDEVTIDADLAEHSAWWYDDSHQLADEAIPLLTYERWQVFTDLCLWQDEAVAEAGIPTITDPAVIDMTAQVTTVLYEVAHRLLWLILTELTDGPEGG